MTNDLAVQKACLAYDEWSVDAAPIDIRGVQIIIAAYEAAKQPKTIREKLVDACKECGLDPDKMLRSEEEIRQIRKAKEQPHMTPKQVADYVAGTMALEGQGLDIEQRAMLEKSIPDRSVDIPMLRRKARRGLFGKNGILKDQFTGVSDAIEFVIDLIPSCITNNTDTYTQTAAFQGKSRMEAGQERKPRELKP